VCSALQVIEHCQDVGEDYTRGRVYLPGEDMRRFGCDESEFARATTSPGLRRVVALQAERATDLLAAGPPLLASLTGFARVAVAGYLAGGHAVLDALAAADHDVLGRRVHPRRSRLLTTWLRLLIANNALGAAPWAGEDRGDPTSIVQRPRGPEGAERDSVDNAGRRANEENRW
jgi:phytoene/squalene synthetase